MLKSARKPERLRELCDEIVVLDGRSIRDHGGATGVVRRHEAAAGSRPESEERSGAPALSEYLSHDRELAVPRVVPAFNASACLRSATIRTPHGRLKRIDAASDEGSLSEGITGGDGIGILLEEARDLGIAYHLPQAI